MTRFSDIYAFGPEAALAELRRLETPNDKPEHDDDTKPDIDPLEHEIHNDRDHAAARQRALMRTWEIGPP